MDTSNLDPNKVKRVKELIQKDYDILQPHLDISKEVEEAKKARDDYYCEHAGNKSYNAKEYKKLQDKVSKLERQAITVTNKYSAEFKKIESELNGMGSDYYKLWSDNRIVH
jgi:peptidoglycan hydrolase CwlO-like protein